MYPDASERSWSGTCSRDKKPLSPKRDTTVSTTVVRNPRRKVPAAASDEQCADGCCGTDSGQGGFPQCASHDSGVSQTVKKLEQIAQAHRQGKGEHKLGWVPLSQILHIFNLQ